VFVGYSVTPGGFTHNWRVLYAIPRKGFDRTVRSNLISFRPEAAAQDSAALECTAMFMFTGENSGVIASIGRIEHAFAQKTLTLAQNGDPLAQLHYAMLIHGYPEIGAQRKEALAWFLKAAQSGFPEAQFVLGYCLLKGIGMQRDESKGVFWLSTAAAGADPEAQAVLAAYTLRDRSDTDSIKRAMEWLDEAVAQQSPDGTLYLSGLLATAPVEELRDPQRSLQLLEKIQKDFDEDPRAVEIRAAAAADLGHQSEAIKYEEAAIGMAQKLGWELTPLAGRLAGYREGKTWSGDLVGW
jgi:TPR repeat protein